MARARGLPARALRWLAPFALLPAAAAQNGDQPGEEQPPLPEHLVLPPSPPLTPAEELATFRLPAGFEIELVAAEPLVGDPVQAAFDDEGRLWVVEMRGYMPDAEAHGEHEPVGSIVTLVDTDGDGRFDERRTFLDGLVLPRSVRPYRDGALVIAPPELLFCRDTDGDGRADEREVVDRGLNGLANPEHAVNGLLPTLDGWFRCADWNRRYRYRDGRWILQPTAGGGQWGLTRDAFGRILFNNNSQALRYDRFPSHYLARNPHMDQAPGANEWLVGGAETFPARPTPGVNRGYREETLRPDGRLARLTAACSPHVHRGTGLGPEAVGDAFVCEPAANLVQRYRLRTRENGGLEAEHLHGELDFLTSTDERFRPVDLCAGPDGALYVVDLYRGIVQHRIYMTTFLRRQVEARGLVEPIGLGRIWRVRRVGVEPAERPDLAEASWTQLVSWLSAPDGFLRDAAQRTIAEEAQGDEFVQGLLRELLSGDASAVAKVHALWSLEAIGGLEAETLGRVLEDPALEVRLAAVRAGETVLDREPRLLARLVARAGEEGGALRHQVLLSLGELDVEVAEPALLALLARDASQPHDRAAALTGLGGRELEVLTRLLDDEAWRAPEAGRPELLLDLARCVLREGRGERIERLLGRLSAKTLPSWQGAALAAGVEAARPAGADGPRRIHLPRRPLAIETVPEAVQAAFVWPGHPEAVDVRPLGPEEEGRFARGRELFAEVCAACHQPSGLGEPGKAPPLRDSPWVQGPPERLVRILDAGLVGPIERAGRRYDLEMPGWVAGDPDVAAILTYLRRAWGHAADPVAPADVTAFRARAPRRSRPWTEAELLESR